MHAMSDAMFRAIPQLSKMLQNLLNWLDKAQEDAKTRGYDVDVLLHSRLAPDQYPLLKQVQAASDAAKFAAARASGKQPPSHPDTEASLDELRTRVRSVVEYLGTFKAEDFDAGRTVELPFLPGKGIKADEYLTAMAVPNFYFHVVTAYAIMRHNGVNVGKRDFIGGLELFDLESAS